MTIFTAEPIRPRIKVTAMNVSKLSRLDLLKHQIPNANGINANVKLTLKALSANTINTSASSIHMVKSF